MYSMFVKRKGSRESFLAFIVRLSMVGASLRHQLSLHFIASATVILEGKSTQKKYLAMIYLSFTHSSCCGVRVLDVLILVLLGSSKKKHMIFLFLGFVLSSNSNAST